MHRVDARSYVGTPGETVTVGTQVSGGGQVLVTVNGQPLAGSQFQLPSTPGASLQMQVSLAGPQGASCVVTIATVDGGADGDLLLCTVHNPAPSHQYTFATAAAAALATLARATTARAPTSRAGARKAAKTTRGATRRKTTGRKKKGGR